MSEKNLSLQNIMQSISCIKREKEKPRSSPYSLPVSRVQASRQGLLSAYSVSAVDHFCLLLIFKAVY